jgi:FkbM family methyltransferase
MGVRERISGALSWVFPKRVLILPRHVRDILATAPLTVIDIGGAMGPDQRFSPLQPDFVRFIMFDPDARSQGEMIEGSLGRDVVVPIGLADAAGRRMLHLSAGPFASSLYPPNLPLLDGFAVAPWYQPVGEVEVDLDTLDAVLARNDGWRPDFIKVDVEGADLDVLRGAPNALACAYGVQIEVSFAERNIGSPFFSEADSMLRNAGFYLFDVNREHWVRKNGLHGATSRSRLMWADAVYFRTAEWVFARMAEGDGPLVRAVALLLAYQAHDTAADLVAQARVETSADRDLLDALDKAVRDSIVSLARYASWGAVAVVAALFIAAPFALLGRRGRGLAGSIVSSEAAPLFASLSKEARRVGLNRGCIPDL